MVRKRSGAALQLRQILEDSGPDAAYRLLELIQSENESIALKASTYVYDQICGKAEQAESAEQAEGARVLLVRDDGTVTVNPTQEEVRE